MILRHTVNASAFEGMVVPVGAGLGGQVLFTLGTGIRRLGDLLAGDPAAVAQVRTLGRQANEASVTLRRSLRELSASSEQLALSVTLRQDCRAFEERTGVSARLILLTDLPSLPEPMIVALTKAAREALLNVEKHAAATSVVVSVFASPRRVTLVVSDDGRGLRSDRVAGLGLAAITDRLSRLGGDVMVGPGDDGGVTVQAWVPIPNLVAGQKRR